MVLARARANLCSTKLTASERAMFTARRKQAYEALHPETCHEAFKGNQHSSGCRQVGDNQPSRFTADTAAKTGQSERKVQRDAERGDKVAADVLDAVRGTGLDTGANLDKPLARCAPAPSCWRHVRCHRSRSRRHSSRVRAGRGTLRHDRTTPPLPRYHRQHPRPRMRPHHRRLDTATRATGAGYEAASTAGLIRLSVAAKRGTVAAVKRAEA